MTDELFRKQAQDLKTGEVKIIMAARLHGKSMLAAHYYAEHRKLAQKHDVAIMTASQRADFNKRMDKDIEDLIRGRTTSQRTDFTDKIAKDFIQKEMLKFVEAHEYAVVTGTEKPKL
jgi:hypothetical protein